MNREELIQELKYGLPSKQMLDVVSYGAVDINGWLIPLKDRYEDGFMFPTDSITYYSKSYFDTHNFEELIRKNVVFAPEVFGRRGLLALIELQKLADKGDLQ